MNKQVKQTKTNKASKQVLIYLTEEFTNLKKTFTIRFFKIEKFSDICSGT